MLKVRFKVMGIVSGCSDPVTELRESWKEFAVGIETSKRRKAWRLFRIPFSKKKILWQHLVYDRDASTT